MKRPYSIRMLPVQPVMSIRGAVTREEIPETIGEYLREVWEHVDRSGAEATGQPFTRYHGMTGETFEVEAGLPVAVPLPSEGRVQPGELPGGEAAITVHVGPYEGLPEAESALESWVEAQGRAPAGPSWEVYLTDPAIVADESEWETEIVKPLAPRPR